ncbi:hypothetical protein GCM10010230_10960 [Streptomyces narbonensis]|nr:hypothetical protein GCM10010230_10960 [Streptomyces narbonensis]
MNPGPPVTAHTPGGTGRTTGRIVLTEVVGGQEQVLRAGLAEDGQPLVAGGGDLGDRLLRGDVDDVEGCAGDPGELDRAVGGLGLQQDLADLPVVAGVGLAAGECLLDEDVDGDAVLRVHHDQPAVVGGALHGAQDPAVVRVEDPRIRHEELESVEIPPGSRVGVLRTR